MPNFTERVVAQATHQMAVQGYVRVPDITKACGVSKQRTNQGFDQAIKAKLATEEQVKEWKQSYQLRTTRVEFRLASENEAWLKAEAARLDISWHDLLNRVLKHHIHNHAIHHP